MANEISVFALTNANNNALIARLEQQIKSNEEYKSDLINSINENDAKKLSNLSNIYGSLYTVSTLLSLEFK